VGAVPALKKTVESFLAGHRQRWGMRAADPLLQGGALVVDCASGEVVFLHRDRFAGDHASIDDIVAAAEEVFARVDAGGGAE
jgi:hypothetical protein